MALTGLAGAHLALGLLPPARLVYRALFSAWTLAHLAGVGVIALATAVEGAELGPSQLAAVLARDTPPAWAQLSPSLTLAGTALAFARMRARGELLALGTLGVRGGWLAGAAALGATALALVTACVGVDSAPKAEVLRVAGGWWIRGAWVPDAGAAPTAPPSEWGAWIGTGALVTAAGLLGSRIVTLPGVLVGAAALVLLDLLARGAQAGPEPGVLVLSLLALALYAPTDALRARSSRR